MTTLTLKRVSRVRGFTLIELMVAVLVGSILLTIAVASYSSQVRKSRRTDAKTAVLDLAGREERYYSTRNAYTIDPTSLGYSSAFPISIGSNYYTLTVALVDAAAGPPATLPGFIVTAKPIGDQLKDTQCGSFTVTDQGVQAATDSGGATSDTITNTCWR